MSLVFCGAFGVSFFCRRQHGGHDAFWPDDERGPFGGVPECAWVKAVQFEIITHRLRTRESRVAFLTHIPRVGMFSQFGDFLVGIEFSSTEALRPFQRRQRIVGPYSLQVGLAIECALWCPGLGGGRCRPCFWSRRLGRPGGGLLPKQ